MGGGRGGTHITSTQCSEEQITRANTKRCDTGWLFKMICYVSGQLQKTLRIPSATDVLFNAAKKANGSLSTITADRRRFVYSTMSR